ncbi:hypothetical protein Bbelb_015800 [Branchiostoma belcheri]|nr:hypothetical protein Bbelb_015800 [Branchiostoma belcheri]
MWWCSPCQFMSLHNRGDFPGSCVVAGAGIELGTPLPLPLKPAHTSTVRAGSYVTVGHIAASKIGDVLGAETQVLTDFPAPSSDVYLECASDHPVKPCTHTVTWRNTSHRDIPGGSSINLSPPEGSVKNPARRGNKSPGNQAETLRLITRDRSATGHGLNSRKTEARAALRFHSAFIANKTCRHYNLTSYPRLSDGGTFCQKRRSRGGGYRNMKQQPAFLDELLLQYGWTSGRRCCRQYTRALLRDCFVFQRQECHTSDVALLIFCGSVITIGPSAGGLCRYSVPKAYVPDFKAYSPNITTPYP